MTFLLFVAVIFCAGYGVAAPMQVLSPKTLHFRSGTKPEWDEFANKTPDAASLQLRFTAHTNKEPATLFIRQDNVKLDWPVEVNGKKVGTLFLMEAPLVHTLRLPVGALRDGENTLTILAPKENDDILIGPITLATESLDAMLSQATLDVQVDDDDDSTPLRSEEHTS